MILAIAILALSLSALSAAYDPYAQASGYRYPYHHTYDRPSRTESHMPDDTTIRIISDSLGVDSNRARLIAVLITYSGLADDDCFSSVREYMSSLMQDMRRAMEGWYLTYEEDMALRALSDRLSSFAYDRRASWNELRWAVEDAFIPMIRLLAGR